MNIDQQIDFLAAAANPFPLKASFQELEGGGYKCKICGQKVKDQNACADHLLAKHREMEAREFSEGRRKKLAKSGKALPGGGFPIVNKEDLGNARQAIGRAKNPAAARAHIRERAKALGVKLPSKWNKNMAAGGPGSGRHKEFGDSYYRRVGTVGESRPYHILEGFGPNGGKWAAKEARPSGGGREFKTFNSRRDAEGHASASQDMDAQVEFSPSMRLRMPKKAGMGTTTENPQYTGGTPPLRAEGQCNCRACSDKRKMEAFGLKRHGMGKGCSSHGFHRGPGYESRARSMGHRLPLAAAADVVIRQRPINRRKKGYSFRGYQGVV